MSIKFVLHRANATLTNAQFDAANGNPTAAQGWASQGNVAFGASAAVLSAEKGAKLKLIRGYIRNRPLAQVI